MQCNSRVIIKPRMNNFACGFITQRAFSKCRFIRYITKFLHFFFFFFLFFCCIFILLSQENDQCAIQARLGVANHLSTTPRWGNPAECFSQRHNKYTWRLVFHTVPLMLSVKQGSCEYQFQSHWFDPTQN